MARVFTCKVVSTSTAGLTYYHRVVFLFTIVAQLETESLVTAIENIHPWQRSIRMIAHRL